MNNNQLENLLKITASRLGTTPDALKSAAQKGEMDKVLGSVPESEHIRKVLSDPEAAKKLLSSPEAQKLLSLLQGKE